MSVLLTGGAGFIGTSLIAALLKQGAEAVKDHLGIATARAAAQGG